MDKDIQKNNNDVGLDEIFTKLIFLISKFLYIWNIIIWKTRLAEPSPKLYPTFSPNDTLCEVKLFFIMVIWFKIFDKSNTSISIQKIKNKKNDVKQYFSIKNLFYLCRRNYIITD